MTDHQLILLVEESSSALGLYDSTDGAAAGRVEVGLWPHEVAVAPNGRTAYVTNFGLRDYDLAIGAAGNSISVIDLTSRCEVHRLYTCTDDATYWAPHGIKVTPDGRRLYVNVERVLGSRMPDPSAPLGMQPTRMLIFDLETRKLIKSFALPPADVGTPNSLSDGRSHEYGVPPGSHNFIFSPSGDYLWLFSGRGGASRLNADSGAISSRLGQYSGAVRGLAFMPSGELLVSATNEVSLADPESGRVLTRISDLGVNQILYSAATPDGRYILAPAVWDGQVVVVDVQKKRVARRIITGVDPVQVAVAPDGQRAYVTHGRSKWATEISLCDLTPVRRIHTFGGPNGIAFAPWVSEGQHGTVVCGACLPFTGDYAAEAREIRLGYQLWQDRVNAAGGVYADGKAHLVQIAFVDTESETDADSMRRAVGALREDSNTAFLLGTFPPEASAHLAQIATDLGIPTVSASGGTIASTEHPYAFAINSPAQGVLADALLAVRRFLSPKPRTVAVISCDTELSRAAAVTTAQAVLRLGMELTTVTVDGTQVAPPGIIVHTHQDTEHSRLAEALRDVGPDMIFHLGHRREAAAIARAVRKARFTPGALAFNCGVTTAAFLSDAGQAAEGVLGIVEWTPFLDNCGRDRFVCAQDYARMYYTEHSETPSFLSAGAAACGVVLEKGISAAGTLLPEGVRNGIHQFDRTTFFGTIAFDKHGANANRRPLVVQLQPVGESLRPAVLWPPELAGDTKLRWPLPD